MIKRILAVVGIVAVLCVSLLLPASALELTYNTNQQVGYQYFVPYNLATGAYTDAGLWYTNNLQLPNRTDAPYLISRAREFGFVISAPETLTDVQVYDLTPSFTGTNLRWMQLTAPTLVYTPTYNDDGSHNINQALRHGLGGQSLDKYFGNASWTMTASYVVTYDDGSRYPAEGSLGVTVASTATGYSESTPTLDYIVEHAFSRASVVNRRIDAVTIFDYKVNFSQSTIPNAVVQFKGYIDHDPEDGVAITPYKPLDEDAIGDTQVVFDGDVGTTDLVIKPLTALLNLPLFGSFTLGSVFAVLGTVGLFVVILKVFAGG